jgi:hypothetical protein
MINKCLKTALLGCLALILAQCSPAEATNVPVNSLTLTTGNISGLETQAAPATSDQSHSMNDSQAHAASATPDQLDSTKDAQILPTASPPTDSGLQSLIDRAIDDLSARLDTNIQNIETVDARQVEWPDASLGCPQTDMAYAQVITPGYRITLKADEKFYIYHTDSDLQVVFCPRGVTLPVTPGEIQDGIPWMPVD